MLILRRMLALALLLYAAVLSHSASATESLVATKMWYPGTGRFYTLADALSFAQTQWCTNGRFDCSTEYVGETYMGYEGTWHYQTIAHYSIRNSDGTISNVSANTGGSIYFECPSGFSENRSKIVPSATCQRPDPILTPCFLCGAAAQFVGNPIFLAGGVKQQVEVDYENATGTLQFVRTYRSDQRKWEHNYSSFATDFTQAPVSNAAPNSCYWGQGTTSWEWRCFDYGPRGQANDVLVRRANGRLLYFGTSTDLSPAKDVNDRVTPALDEAGKRIGLQVTNGQTDAIEIYDLNGRLVSSRDRNGQTTTFTYSAADTPKEVAPREGLLLTVADTFGHELHFSYDDHAQLTTMRDPAGSLYRYTYNANGTLDKVTYPDGKERRYVYGELDKTSGASLPYALTGIIDENNVRFATYTYDSSGRAISTEHAGGVEKYTATYPYSDQAIVIDPLGTKRTYNSISNLNVYRAYSTDQPNLLLGGNYVESTSISYDVNGNISRFQNFDRSTTTYTYDLARNLETKRVEGSGSTVARTISTEWHPTYRLPMRIAEPKRITSFTYDDHGNVLTRTVQATTDANGMSAFSATASGLPKTWTYTYDTFGHVLTVKAPRTDVNPISTFTYDAEGNLATSTNAAGHTTTYSNYDLNGRVGRVTDPNGLITDITYKPRGWPSSISSGGETTSYDYDGVGQVIQATLPDGSALSYTYDGAHRLTAIRDSQGHSITYVLDPMGNRISEQSKDASGTLTRQITRVYDALNRVKQVSGAQQ